MSRSVPLIRLVERAGRDGEPLLTGWLGMARVTGRLGTPTADGETTWILSLVEDDRPREAFRQRKAKRERGA